jgi:hypothetical protein
VAYVGLDLNSDTRPVLKCAREDEIVNTLCHRSYTHCVSLVTGETSIVYFTLRSSGFVLGIVNRYHGN